MIAAQAINPVPRLITLAEEEKKAEPPNQQLQVIAAQAINPVPRLITPVEEEKKAEPPNQQLQAPVVSALKQNREMVYQLLAALPPLAGQAKKYETLCRKAKN